MTRGIRKSQHDEVESHIHRVMPIEHLGLHVYRTNLRKPWAYVGTLGVHGSGLRTSLAADGKDFDTFNPSTQAISAISTYGADSRSVLQKGPLTIHKSAFSFRQCLKQG